MKEEKNLDRLFQEKFKDFERHPSDAVWKNIALAQNEAEDRKIIPLWWRLAGAAAIALLLTTGIVLFNNSSSNTLENPIVTTSDTPQTNTNQVTQTQINPSNADKDEPSTLSETVANTNELLNTSPIAQNDENTSSATKESSVLNTNQTVVNNTNKTVIESSITTVSQDKVNSVAIAKESTPTTNPIIDTAKNQEILKEQITANSGVAQNTQKIKDATQETTAQEKISLIEEAKRIEEKNEAIATVEDIPTSQRWDAGAVAAPVFYGNFGGSGLDPSFNDNAKSSNLNFSYGVQVSYAVNPKLKVRTGVSNVDLSYNTNGIAFDASSETRRSSSVNFSDNARTLSIGDAGRVRAESSNTQDNLFPENGNAINILEGSLQQRLGFVEIPVEAVYVVSDRRFGVQVVGGVSTLLLNNNEVILNAADGLQSNLGSANGINEVSFTSNIGLGLDYKMTDKLKFNVEPSLKYQLNTFDESVGDFKPYFVGLYTGVSYRF